MIIPETLQEMMAEGICPEILPIDEDGPVLKMKPEKRQEQTGNQKSTEQDHEFPAGGLLVSREGHVFRLWLGAKITQNIAFPLG